MATLFNGSLCIYVSTLNSVATVTWEDFISHIPMFHKIADFKQLCAIKILGVTYAVICMGLAYVVSMFSGVIEISMFVNAATSGTLVGVFILAMVVPFAKGKGASIGMITSHAVIIALSITSYLGKNMMKTEFLPSSIEGCNATANHSFLYSDEEIDYERMSRVNLTFSEVPLAEDIFVESPHQGIGLKPGILDTTIFCKLQNRFKKKQDNKFQVARQQVHDGGFGKVAPTGVQMPPPVMQQNLQMTGPGTSSNLLPITLV